jgi:hypothetical protein
MLEKNKFQKKMPNDLGNFAQYYHRDKPEFYILTRYFVLNLISGKVHQFRLYNIADAKPFYP